MNVLINSGTYNRRPRTHRLLSEVQKVCTEYEIVSVFAELCGNATSVAQKVTWFRFNHLIVKVELADVITCATPNYQGSMIGFLKVIIDHIPEHGPKDKSIGLIAVSDGICIWIGGNKAASALGQSAS